MKRRKKRRKVSRPPDWRTGNNFVLKGGLSEGSEGIFGLLSRFDRRYNIQEIWSIVMLFVRFISDLEYPILCNVKRGKSKQTCFKTRICVEAAYRAFWGEKKKKTDSFNIVFSR